MRTTAIQSNAIDLMAAARSNDAFRRVIETGEHEQVVVMTIPEGADIGSEVHADTDQVFIVGNTPKLPQGTGVCLSNGHPDLGDCAFPPGPVAVREARTSFAAAEAAGVDFVDASKWFCAYGRCPAVIGNYIALRDSHHMTPDYSRWLATPLAAELGLGAPPAPR